MKKHTLAIVASCAIALQGAYAVTTLVDPGPSCPDNETVRKAIMAEPAKSQRPNANPHRLHPPPPAFEEQAADLPEERDSAGTKTDDSPFPVFKEGDYFDTALCELEYLLIRNSPDSEPGFNGAVVAFLYTRNYLGLRRFAETLNLIHAAYPEGVAPALVLYKTWRIANPTLRDAPIFMKKLREHATAEKNGTAATKLVEWLEKYIEKNEAYGDSLDEAADAWLAANGVAFAENLAPAAPILHDIQIAGYFEDVVRQMRPCVDAGSCAPVYHVSVPNPMELIPLTITFDAMQIRYDFTGEQMAAAAFALYCFLEEDVPGRVIGSNGLYKLVFQLGVNARRGLGDDSLVKYSVLGSRYCSDLSRRLHSIFLRLDAPASDTVETLFSSLAIAYKKRGKEAAKLLRESVQTEEPANEEAKAMLYGRQNSLRQSVWEYEHPDEGRRRNKVFR